MIGSTAAVYLLVGLLAFQAARLAELAGIGRWPEANFVIPVAGASMVKSSNESGAAHGAAMAGRSGATSTRSSG